MAMGNSGGTASAPHTASAGVQPAGTRRTTTGTTCTGTTAQLLKRSAHGKGPDADHGSHLGTTTSPDPRISHLPGEPPQCHSSPASQTTAHDPLPAVWPWGTDTAKPTNPTWPAASTELTTGGRHSARASLAATATTHPGGAPESQGAQTEASPDGTSTHRSPQP